MYNKKAYNYWTFFGIGILLYRGNLEKKCTCDSRIIMLQFSLWYKWYKCTYRYFRIVDRHFLVISAENGCPSMHIKINDIIQDTLLLLLLYTAERFILMIKSENSK